MRGDPVCDLFIRSYWKDFQWLGFCLASIHKYCRGFRSVVVVVPQSSEPWLRRTRLPANTGPMGMCIAFCRDYRDDYLGQQATKMLADTFTDAPYICHIDSDCVFCRATTPHHLIDYDKPRILRRPIAEMGPHYPWLEPTRRFLGWTAHHDFMQRPPFVFPRWLYPKLRDYVVAAHGIRIEDYIEAQPPRGFSEFNALGAFAWERHREHFTWIDAGSDQEREAHCRWYWSWGGIDDAIRSEIMNILRE